MASGLEEDKAGVAFELNKNNDKGKKVSPMAFRHLEKLEYQQEKKEVMNLGFVARRTEGEEIESKTFFKIFLDKSRIAH
jgi:hypothetical protein